MSGCQLPCDLRDGRAWKEPQTQPQWGCTGWEQGEVYASGAKFKEILLIMNRNSLLMPYFFKKCKIYDEQNMTGADTLLE